MKNEYIPVEQLFRVAEKYKPSLEVIPLNMPIFDNAMDGGVRGGELITVSAQTGHGKTTFLQNLTIRFHEQQVPVLWFTYEMSPWYLKEKFVSMGQDKDLLAYSPMELVEQSKEFVDAKIKEALFTESCKIVMIDHLHYLIPLQGGSNTSMLVGAIVRELKKMAVKHDVCIFLIAHTKKVYQAEELGLDSIRDSSLVAQESDYVFLIERVKKEKGNLKLSLKPVEPEYKTDWTNIMKVSLAKNRRRGEMVYNHFKINNNIMTHTDETK